MRVAVDDTGHLEAKVLGVEPLMGETEVRLELDSGQRLIALLPDDDTHTPEVGAQLGLTCLPEALHLFDATSGQAL